MNLLEHIVQIDHSASLWLNNLSQPWNDGFWWTLSDIPTWVPFYVIMLLYILWKLGWKKGLGVILTLVLTIVLIDQSSNLIKDSVARLRPCYDAWMVNNGLRLPYGNIGFGAYGFFSAHAGNSFGFATATYLGLQWNKPESHFGLYGVCVYLWAALMSISRIMMGAHFLGDILVGALVGCGLGLLCSALARQILVKVSR